MDGKARDHGSNLPHTHHTAWFRHSSLEALLAFTRGLHSAVHDAPPRLGPNFQGKKILHFNFLILSFTCLYLGALLYIVKGF